MSERNKAVIRRFVEEYQSGAHDEAVARELLAPDFVNHNPFRDLPPDREGVIAFFDVVFGAFPDFHAEIRAQVAEGDLVTTRKTFHGTHRGAFMDVAPTGRVCEWDVIDIIRVVDGQMREHWNVVDAMGLMQQLGAVPGSGGFG